MTVTGPFVPLSMFVLPLGDGVAGAYTDEPMALDVGMEPVPGKLSDRPADGNRLTAGRGPHGTGQRCLTRRKAVDNSCVVIGNTLASDEVTNIGAGAIQARGGKDRGVVSDCIGDGAVLRIDFPHSGVPYIFDCISDLEDCGERMGSWRGP